VPTSASIYSSLEGIEKGILITLVQVRQCLIYDTPFNPARLIGVEYMITPRLYETLDEQERKLWHSHDYEACDDDLSSEPESMVNNE
jgi:hypothetical protein